MKLRLLGLLLLLASGAFADFTLYLDTELGGSTAPAGSPAWVTATFQDIGGGVQLTINALNLSDHEFISRFYFNFNPAKDAASFLTSEPKTGTQTDLNAIKAENDRLKAGGFGSFDFELDFPPPLDKFTAGETFVLNIMGPGLTADDFLNTSIDGLYAVAKVQGGARGWITGDTSDASFNSPQATVPEPGSVVLLGTVLIGVSYILRKRLGAIIAINGGEVTRGLRTPTHITDRKR